MEIIAYEMTYLGEDIDSSGIECIPFQPSIFEEYMRIYNDCFYDMRKALDIEPYHFLNSYEQIADKVENIYLLMKENQIIGSVACYGNEIDDLIVNQKYQHQGYGKQLLLWGMEQIRKDNAKPITLHVAKWNENAVSLYEKVGFVITNSEKIR